MHRAIVSRFEKVGPCRVPLRWAASSAFFALGFACSVAESAPDPDLFDGRVVSTSSSFSGSGDDSAEEASKVEPELETAQGRDEARGGGGTASSSSGSAVSAAAQEGEGLSAVVEGGSSEDGVSRGAGASASPQERGGGRDFSSIGGVGADAVSDVLPVNSSKVGRLEPLASAQEPEASGAPVLESSADQEQGPGIGSGGSQPLEGIPQGDYGDSLPPGL